MLVTVVDNVSLTFIHAPPTTNMGWISWVTHVWPSLSIWTQESFPKPFFHAQPKFLPQASTIQYIGTDQVKCRPTQVQHATITSPTCWYNTKLWHGYVFHDSRLFYLLQLHSYYALLPIRSSKLKDRCHWAHRQGASMLWYLSLNPPRQYLLAMEL